jgi:hypothetical protein
LRDAAAVGVDSGEVDVAVGTGVSVAVDGIRVTVGDAGADVDSPAGFKVGDEQLTSKRKKIASFPSSERMLFSPF